MMGCDEIELEDTVTVLDISSYKAPRDTPFKARVAHIDSYGYIVVKDEHGEEWEVYNGDWKK